MKRCPVCLSSSVQEHTVVDAFLYHRCITCCATYLDSRHFLSRDQELQHYQTHENEIDDPRYRNFLSRLFVPMLARIRPSAVGIDFGSGPGPALAAMFREAGHEMATYDPFFSTDKKALLSQYDFITCSETVEHFHQPDTEFARFDELLRPGGVLGIMTSFQSDERDFSSWHYRKDPTHVVFYQTKTFEVIAERYQWRCELPEQNIVFLHKPDVQDNLNPA